MQPQQMLEKQVQALQGHWHYTLMEPALRPKLLCLIEHTDKRKGLNAIACYLRSSDGCTWHKGTLPAVERADILHTAGGH